MLQHVRFVNKEGKHIADCVREVPEGSPKYVTEEVRCRQSCSQLTSFGSHNQQSE